MEADEINFDDHATVKAMATEKVEITVGELAFLLNSFYMGGGEPHSRNDRLQFVKQQHQDYL